MAENSHQDIQVSNRIIVSNRNIAGFSNANDKSHDDNVNDSQIGLIKENRGKRN